MTFPKILPSIFSRTISLNALLGLGIMIDDNVLKWDSQWPNLMHVSAILIRFLRHVTSLTIILRCLQDSLLGPEVNELLYFTIKLVNSSSENGFHLMISLLGISSNKSILIWWFCTELKNKCRACHRLSNLRHSWPWYWMALMARRMI